MQRVIACHIVSWNSKDTIVGAVKSLLEQSDSTQKIVVRVTDNASRDETVQLLEHFFPGQILISENFTNRGFCAAHNDGVRWALSIGAHSLLVFNPDAALAPDALRRMDEVLENFPEVGAVTPKILRANLNLQPDEPAIIDACGMHLTSEFRHFDRGSNETDYGQYDQPEYVFGATGAAVLFSRECIEDASFENYEFLDEKFFAYREDAELSLRLQRLGWRVRYEPSAIAFHVRRVLPERRDDLPDEINLMGVRNRFLLQWQHFSLRAFSHCLFPTLKRNLLVIGGVILKERSSLPALAQAWEALPKSFERRTAIRKRQRISAKTLGRFAARAPYSELAPPLIKTPQSLKSVGVVLTRNSYLVSPKNVEKNLVPISLLVDQAKHELPQLFRMELVEPKANSVTSDGKQFSFDNFDATQISSYDALLFLDSEVELTADSFRALLEMLRNNSTVSAVGGNFSDRQNQALPNRTARRSPRFLSTIAESVGFSRDSKSNLTCGSESLAGDRVITDALNHQPVQTNAPHFNPSELITVESLNPGCILLRTQDFLGVGGFDSRFTTEDFAFSDLFLRLKRTGMLVGVCAKAIVKDVQNSELPSNRITEDERSKHGLDRALDSYLFWDLYGTPTQSQLLNCILRAQFAIKVLLISLVGNSVEANRFRLAQRKLGGVSRPSSLRGSNSPISSQSVDSENENS